MALLDSAPSAEALGSAGASEPDLQSPDLYLNRELTWLAFNQRVLHEARDPRNPLLERVKFLAITASNLDEFFMKRIGGLKVQIAAGMQECTVDGRTPRQQIDECYAVIRDFEEEQRQVLRQVRALLEVQQVRLLSYASLPLEQRQALREHYLKSIFPLVTPQVLDPAHPFPFISNLSLNLLVTGRHPGEDESLMARIKVPLGFGIPRFLRVGDRHQFVRLEEVMAQNLDLLFPELQVDTCDLFRVTRNANTERDEDDADDLLELIETELRDRRMAPIVRLEVSREMEPLRRTMLATELGLDEQADVFEAADLLAPRDLVELVPLDDPTLHDPPYRAVDHPRLPANRDVFQVLRDAGSLLLVHPYQSFASSVERFLREASEDPRVRAIKMTLYRTSSDARIIGSLCEAARNGKQVAVVVELKARFDEATNIHFASQLEDFGIHVSYGVLGYKTHAKVILVVRQDQDGLRRYAHVGTGNYHPGTARLYADIGLLTCDEAIGQDLTELFNFLTTGYQPRRTYRKILPAPALLKKALLDKIEREARLGSAGALCFKMNALEDEDVTAALYRAARAGVKVDLLVRDTCRLRPGLPHLSERVRVVSIVGRFLEHGRIYYFQNGGAEEYFIGSADCMKRNLESRIEVLAPVEDAGARKLLRTILEVQMAPNRNAWEMQPDGSYVQGAQGEPCGAQEALMDLFDQTSREATEPDQHRQRQRSARRSAQGTEL